MSEVVENLFKSLEHMQERSNAQKSFIYKVRLAVIELDTDIAAIESKFNPQPIKVKGKPGRKPKLATAPIRKEPTNLPLNPEDPDSPPRRRPGRPKGSKNQPKPTLVRPAPGSVLALIDDNEADEDGNFTNGRDEGEVDFTNVGEVIE